MKLTRKITATEFDNGYWYAQDLKSFAREIGIQNTSKLRKDQLEKLIKEFIRTGKVQAQKHKNRSLKGNKDYELGLTLSLPVRNFVDNNETKDFIKREALKIRPKLKKKSGAQYRLNRWRDRQLNKGKRITYGDLIKQYIKLNETKGAFERIPHGRYINFLADYLANEKATRADAIKAWNQLKKRNVPKDYRSWKKSIR